MGNRRGPCPAATTVTGVASSPDPAAVAAVRAALARIAAETERDEEVLATTLAVTGDPATQRALDAWVDTAVDALRALAASAGQECVHLDLLMASRTPEPTPQSASTPAATGERSLGPAR